MKLKEQHLSSKIEQVKTKLGKDFFQYAPIRNGRELITLFINQKGTIVETKYHTQLENFEVFELKVNNNLLEHGNRLDVITELITAYNEDFLSVKSGLENEYNILSLIERYSLKKHGDILEQYTLYNDLVYAYYMYGIGLNKESLFTINVVTPSYANIAYCDLHYMKGEELWAKLYHKRMTLTQIEKILTDFYGVKIMVEMPDEQNSPDYTFYYYDEKGEIDGTIYALPTRENTTSVVYFITEIAFE
jgi:hypothetical protein